MIEKPMDVLQLFPIRRNKKQKEAFRAAVQSYLDKLGYSVAMEETSFGGINMVIGDSKIAKYLVTAHYECSAVVTLFSIAESLPVIHREKVCFVLFDLEEYGLIGSASYRKTHKEETEKQIVLNLDCVGDGDHIVFFPTKKLKKDRRKLNPLYTCCGQFGNKFVTIRDKGFANYPSDQNKFPYGVGIAALRKGKLGLQLSRIHTKKDTILDQTNINILRSALITYITCTK